MPMISERSISIGTRYRAGESIGLLAAEYGVSRQRIFQIAKATGKMRQKFNKKGSPGPRSAQIIALRETRMSYGQISVAMGATNGAISSVLRRWRPDLLGPIRPSGRSLKKLAFAELTQPPLEGINTAPEGQAVMPNSEPTSLAQEAFRGQREAFEREFEQFLTSLATPVEARRQEAIETIQRLGEIGGRLRKQGVL